jgi:hypothetical protein
MKIQRSNSGIAEQSLPAHRKKLRPLKSTLCFNRDHERGASEMVGFRQRAAEGLQVGDSFRTSRTFTDDDVIRFAKISRDYNPVHFDARFAKARNLPAPICHGLLAASLVTEIGGQIGWLASAMNFRFKGPVYVWGHVWGQVLKCK